MTSGSGFIRFRWPASAIMPVPLVAFDLMAVLRTPYRIDILQPLKFEICSFAKLAACLEQNPVPALEEAQLQGNPEPLFDGAV